MNNSNKSCFQLDQLKVALNKSESESRSVVSNSLRPHGLYSTWNSPGKNARVGSHSLLQGIFSPRDWTQVSRASSHPGIEPSWTRIGGVLHQLSHQESPRILEWVAYPFSGGSSRPRNGTRVSCITGGLFTNWATREALLQHWMLSIFSKS